MGATVSLTPAEKGYLAAGCAPLQLPTQLVDQVEQIVAARENAVHLEWLLWTQRVTGLRLMTVDEARDALERRGDPE
jgi:hypothetical protein